jgi:hypothetical protein
MNNCDNDGEEEDCSICGIPLKDKYQYKLSCNHVFHYECLLKTFVHSKQTDFYSGKYKNKCPYCRGKCEYLPIVNGLNKVIVDIHYKYEKPELKCTRCKAVLQRGKNKGNVCNKKCLLGYEYCGLHKKQMKFDN